MTVQTYSLKQQGEEKVAANYSVREFACKDGSDLVLVDDELVTLLQKIRDHFRQPVTITSAYRTASHNQAVGGATGSRHLYGTAADIQVAATAPAEVAQYAEYLQAGGIGLYQGFVHLDTRLEAARWDQRSGQQVPVSGFPGYLPAADHTSAQAEAGTKAQGGETGEMPVGDGGAALAGRETLVRIYDPQGRLQDTILGYLAAGVTWVPIRPLGAALGARVAYDGKEVKIYR